MRAWLKRFGLHLAAAVGATGIFVAAAAVGANQTRQQVAAVAPVEVASSPAPRARRKPTVEVAPTPGSASNATQPQVDPTQVDSAPTSVPLAPGPPNQPASKPGGQPRRTATPIPAAPSQSPATPAAAAPASDKIVPERSLAGTVQAVLADGLDVLGVGGRQWRVVPAPGALIRLNGKTVRLEALRAGDVVVILGQAQGKDGPRFKFVSHAITARRK